MALYGDHTHQQLRKLNKFKIQEFFEMNKHPWKQLVEITRLSQNHIPVRRKFRGYEFNLDALKIQL